MKKSQSKKEPFSRTKKSLGFLASQGLRTTLDVLAVPKIYERMLWNQIRNCSVGITYDEASQQTPFDATQTAENDYRKRQRQRT